MREIRENIQRPSYNTKSWRLYTEGLSAAVFDIETTGLSPGRNSLILGGLLTLDQADQKSHDQNPQSDQTCQRPQGKRVLCQYLANSPQEEKALLEQYLSELSKAHIWISYNGDAFDRPFLAQRLSRTGLRPNLPLHQSIDLYRLFRRYSPLAKFLPNLKQTTVETALGLSDHRKDRITGRDSAALYMDYVKTGNKELEDKILLHNHDDLLQLDQLLSMLNKLDLHRIMFEQGFLIKLGDKKLLIEKITLDKNILHLNGRSQGIKKDWDIFKDVYKFSHQAEDRRFTLILPCIYEKNAAFVDTETLAPIFNKIEKTDPLQAPISTCFTSSPFFINGYLLFQDGRTLFYREINQMAKLLLTEILKEI